MTIDKHFLETVPAGIFVAAILYFSFRRRAQHSRRWRVVISAVLAVGTAPTVFPDMSAGFSVPHFFPQVMFYPAVLSDPTIFSVRGIVVVFLLLILPFVLTTVFWLFLGYVLRRWLREYASMAA